MTAIWCELALVDGTPQPDVLIDITEGRFERITIGAQAGDATRLAGFTVPGLANAHSHAFHRALRSRTQSDRGTFWTWREMMYRAAERLEPDTYHGLARATFAEMAMAGISCVGEFHYLHHQPDGTPYVNPNAMGEAVLAAASDAGIRITLLDTLYLRGALHADGYRAPTVVQRRFSDGAATEWAARVDRLAVSSSQRVGAAIHSVRAVDPRSMQTANEWIASVGVPVHAHVSEQVAENDVCVTHHGVSPVALLSDAGLLSDRFSAVHATHLVGSDVKRLATAGATVVMCPTTERDLGDGVGPTRELVEHDIPIALGSDSHAVIDLFEEARALELNERLNSHQRGHHGAPELLQMATSNGHRSLGWDDAGVITVGNRADLTTVCLDSVRTAGARDRATEASVFAATAGDVTDVFVDGRHVVAEGRHAFIDVAAELEASIRELMR